MGGAFDINNNFFCIYKILELYKGERGEKVVAKASHRRKKERKV